MEIRKKLDWAEKFNYIFTVIARLHWAERFAPGPPTGGDIPRQFFCLEKLCKCTMELTKDKADRNAFSNSELEFFHSARDFRKNLYKNIEKKKL